MKFIDNTSWVHAGMTLLEVMIALFLLCVGIISVAAMIDIGMISNRRAQSSVENTISAAAMLERVLALDYDDPLLEDRDDGFHPQKPDHGPIVLPGQITTMEWEVGQGVPASNTKRVQVTVRPADRNRVGGVQQYDYVKARNLIYPASDNENN